LHDRAFYQLAEEIVLMVRRYDDAVLIINDRVDIALKVKADGIHIGQEDENYREVISRAPKTMIVGVSVDTVNEAIEAEQAGATYIGAGSIFPTPSKSDAKLIGIEILRQIVKSVSIPVVAIGGIGMRNIHRVMETGARYYAMISEINNAKDIPGRLRELFSIVKKGETGWN
jgi:thiamine-phosphate pyrophosphorylase